MLNSLNSLNSKSFLSSALAVATMLVCLLPGRAVGADQAGLFEASGDIGTVLHPGAVVFDADHQSYTITGSGENVWFASDHFQFTWKKAQGDIALAADVAFVGAGKNPHRKALLMIRQSLDADSAYADIALHGVGLTSLQYRAQKGGATHEVQANVTAPGSLRIEKRGKYIYMWLGADADHLQLAGGSPRLVFEEPFYVGIGVCSHEKETSETAVFSKVNITAAAGTSPTLYSALETVTIASTDRKVIRIAADHIEAPNWTRDGFFLFNKNGHIFKMPVAGGDAVQLDTGTAIRCNNDHGLSPDGKWLAISDQTVVPHQSIIYIVPVGGGAARRVTQLSPSYWHGWSPDGTTLAYCAQRNTKFDIYTIAANAESSTQETRLTTAPGLSDGPEYSPDGAFIYFNSDRTGLMQIWRMHPDGSGQEQITSDDQNNWFAHISPDGKWMAFLTFDKSVSGHPANKDVSLRLMNVASGKITVLAEMFGGQGTMNVPSWSPDSKQLAFVSYDLASR